MNFLGHSIIMSLSIVVAFLGLLGLQLTNMNDLLDV